MTQTRLPDAPWLASDALTRLFDLLDTGGETARVVGGAVRNEMLGLPVSDIDVATTAAPDEIVRRAKTANIRAVPTGIDHGTVTLIVGGQPFEVTTLREDVETFGRKAKVAFGRDWKRDAERRDFTMNALSVSRDGVVHDYVGGIEDLKARHVRFIGDPALRIAEDYLRILRFFRFHAAYGEGAPDKAALSACIAARAGLDTLSRERVRMEMLKLLVAPRAVDAMNVMADAGLLVCILGGVPLTASLARLAAVEAALNEPPDAVRRLGALAVQVTEDAERLFERLRLSNAEYQRLLPMSEGWWRVASEMSAQSARALLYRLGAERFADRVLLAWSRSQDRADDARWREFAALPKHWTPPPCPISSGDLIRRGVAKGPALGAALRSAEEEWIAADFPNDKVSIDSIADNAARAAAA